MSLWEKAIHFVTHASVVVATTLGALFGQNHTQVVVLKPQQTFGQSVATTSTASNISTATSTKMQIPKQTSKSTVPKTVASPSSKHVESKTQVTAVASSTPPLDRAQLNTQVRASLVNILCTTQAGGIFHPISGSGVIVDSRGVILTNAHLGQYFLLHDYPFANNIECVIRTGSPAQPMYKAELVYLPPQWVDVNASGIVEEHPTGTGENDYAFLRITGSVNPSTPLPPSFPALPLSAGGADIGDDVLLAAYPAGFLDGTTIATNLYASSSYTSVKALFSYEVEPQVDLISISGTVVSQSGSSGGAVVSASTGRLIGIIVTDTAGDTTSQRDLRAITLLHIDSSLAQSGRGGIANLLNGDLQKEVSSFNSTLFNSEKQALVDVLKK